MNNALMYYLDKRLRQNELKYHSIERQPGPVICISREVGCGGVNIARHLATELDKKLTVKKWKVLSKEILSEGARELNMDPYKLRKYLKEGERTLFDDILLAFSETRYKSDRKISKTLIELITSFAEEGHCIIVGRAGHIIARDIEKSLFVKLIAPLDWRIKKIMEKNDLKIKEAVEFIEKTEKERLNFIKHISNENDRENEFDLIINVSRLTTAEVVDIIRFAAKTKGLAEPSKSKVEVY